MTANVAIIVPVLDDAAALSNLLAQISSWQLKPREVIVVSGQPEPALDALCAQHGCRLINMPASRGAQLDRGASEAQAAVLWFLHADASAPANGLTSITSALARHAESGCFRFQFQGRPIWYKNLLKWLIAMRIRLGGVPYGDQGIFALREVYLACGGFPHQPLFEEVRLIKRFKRRGTFRVLSAPMAVSTRRWDRDGWWARSWRNRWLALCYLCGMPAERLAGSYRRTDNAENRIET